MWNYRVVRKRYVNPGTERERYTYAIHEAYYDNNGHVGAVTRDPVEPYGENIEELRHSWIMMAEAFGLPILDFGSIPEPGYERKEDPMAKVGEQTISVTPAAIVKMSDKTYQIRWTEDIYSKEGAPTATYRMTGLITIDFSQPSTEKEMMNNPLGLYVSDFSWSKEL